MHKSKKIVVRSSELPIQLEVIGSNGEHANYNLMPAGRKFGAFLTGNEQHKQVEPMNRSKQGIIK